MEGTRDGEARDSCFYCGLLYPRKEPCPRCGNRLRYRPAENASVRTRPDELRRRWQAHRDAPTRASMEAFLTFLYEGDVADLGVLSVSLDELRDEYERLT